MRIISGIYGSRRISAPKDNSPVRPTTDRARESLMNILLNKTEIKGKTIIDLFCGTGSVGLEFLSRGAERCYFIDKNVKLAEQNIKSLNAEDIAFIIKSDAETFMKEVSNIKYDIIFADPPYGYKNYNRLIDLARKSNSYFILEHGKDFQPDKEYGGIETETRTSGITSFSFFPFDKNK